MLGEIPGNVRAYYKLENINDSGPNGYNLTNVNSVPFTSARLSNGADLGTTGTNKGFSYGANVFSTTTPANVFFSMIVKFNSTANDATRRFLFVMNTKSSATDGRQWSCSYTISSGNFNIIGSRVLSTGGLQDTSPVVVPVSSGWYLITLREFNDDSESLVLNVWNLTTNQVRSGGVFIGAGGSLTNAPTIFLSIGNTRGFANQSYVTIDEFIIAEDTYVPNIVGQGSRRRYITQLQGYSV
jgi:hypothetical protein